MTTTNPIVRKLAETLNARTEAALLALASLDAEIMAVLDEAEENARVRFHTAQLELDLTVKERLDSFAGLLADLSADAIGRATCDLLAAIEDFSPIVTTASESEPTPEPVADPNAAFVARSREFAEVAYAARQAAEQEQEANPEPTPESTPALTVPDASGKQVPWRSQFEAQPVAQPTEQEPEAPAVPSPVAAHAVESAPVGVLPEDDQDQDDQDQDGIEDAGVMYDDGITTTVARGLHSRSGEGRKTRYTPVGTPVPGVLYYRKNGRKWEPVWYVA